MTARTSVARRLSIGRRLKIVVLVAVQVVGGLVGLARADAADPCVTPVNVIACENSKTGSPWQEWETTSDDTVAAFATDISTAPGGRVDLKVNAPGGRYTIDIFRVGYYGGDGARRVATVNPSVSLPQTQPACLQEQSTGLVDCGNWAVSASWNVPSTAVSGVYFAYIERTDSSASGDNNIALFVVRDDTRRSAVLFQTSDTTWQAYNRYGGNSLYFGNPVGRAYKASYNRPIANAGQENELWNAEYPMIRWLEANGYDVSYTTGIDSDRRGAEILEHKVFMTVGHDEYWSGQQRNNVEAARNAGVSMMFLAGNDAFWKVRYEPSLDASHTAQRTMVVYKSTLDGAQTDPTGAWTGTWRDRRFSPPADGGRPENALLGTIFTVNGYVRDAITVPAAYSPLRIWRNTTVRNLVGSQVATFPVGTLGYEWNSDLDNGFRPPGLVRLSSTTVVHNDGDYVIQDEGSVYAPGTATHNLTLYKHASGALVFSAGTVQWSWGLDDNHSLGDEPVDVRMQQATVNILADMKVQPTTIQAGLVATSASTDTAAPTVNVTAPANGATVNTGQTVNITGTASDAGGVVGAVEVSTDGGATWHPANGTTSWSYQWVPKTLGSASILARAVDDSANIGSAVTRNVTVSFQCPCTLFSASATPVTPAANDSSAVELGMRFTPDRDGLITGVRFYKGTGNSGTHTGSLWTTAGQQLATVTFTNETATGWQQALFSTPVAVNAATTYIVSYFAPNGRYAADGAFFASAGYTNAPLSAPQSTATAGNGVYRGGSTGFPGDTYGSSNYWVDVVFTLNLAPPAVGSRIPGTGASSVPLGTNVSATFTKSMQPATIQFSLRDAGGATVAGNGAYAAATRTYTFDPSANLVPGATYTATVSSGTDTGGIAMTAPVSWTFTAAGGNCPCSIWPTDSIPANPSVNDSGAVEVGVRFSPTIDGVIQGIRFYKGAGNTGTHTGSLWTTGGQLLASATFTNETASGWQQVLFATPVPVAAGTTYVASYFAPVGHYAADGGYFSASGWTNGPLASPASIGGAGNGIYRYGSTSGFPGDTWGAANYWVDVVYGRDTSAPTVTAQNPSPTSTSVPIASNVTATWSKAMAPASIQFTLRDAGGATVPAALTYDATTRVSTLNPTSDLVPGASYTATIPSATDALGNPLGTPVTWTFSTQGITACPCTLFPSGQVPGTADAGDPGAVEVGVRFSPTVDGVIQGVRFYKSAANTGTHLGSLWTSTGQLLATATFTGESASGWQQVTFTTPVAVTAGTTYVASYHAPNGHYSADGGFFASAAYSNPPLVASQSVGGAGNGVYRYGSASGFPSDTWGAANYWVDVVFGGDTTPPTVTGRSPSVGATGIATATNVTATFSEPVTPASIQVQLQSGTGTSGPLVPAAVTYDAPSRTATLNPTADLAPATAYTAIVAAATDATGNTLAAPVSWTFTTAGAAACPCSLWPASTVPGTPDVNDGGPLTVGVRITPDLNGTITGVRFYKGAGNTGTHIGAIWDSTGQQLATAPFANETATGWQQALFTTPVTVTAGTTYVVGYFLPNGHYAADSGYFSSAPYVNAPLRSPQSVGGAGNGLYRYGSALAFPTDTWGAANYWVDVVYQPS